jgi:hypothetical protein
MKLPRWLVISMLTASLLAVLTAAGWSWATWPERTVRKFLTMHRDGKWVEAAQIFGVDAEYNDLNDEDKDYWRGFFERWRLAPGKPRSPSDILLGRQTFRIICDDESSDEFYLTTERGKVILIR